MTLLNNLESILEHNPTIDNDSYVMMKAGTLREVINTLHSLYSANADIRSSEDKIIEQTRITISIDNELLLHPDLAMDAVLSILKKRIEEESHARRTQY